MQVNIWLVHLTKSTYSLAAFEMRMAIAIQAINVEKPKILHIKLNVSRPDNWIARHQTSITPAIICSNVAAAIKRVDI
jgi:UDP-N-acetyl-D-mannosaminuronic acid transferase (WecB/TagA/CpsF family)